MTQELLPVTYAPLLVALSYLVSALGAFTALSAAAAAHRANRQVNRFNIFLAGLALGGVGIWSMHFVGMLGWKVQLGVGYRLLETVVSLVAAVLVSALALGYVAADPGQIKRVLVAGPLAGLGVAVMHYLGMYSMSFGGYFDWNMLTVGISIVIAMFAATAALWLAFRTRERWQRIVAALVMAAAVCTMHYTGMAAASVVCTTSNRYAIAPELLRPADLPWFVTLIAFGVAFMIVLDLRMQRMTSLSPAIDSRMR